MQDKTIKCKDCGKNFVFTVRDQEFYKEKGYDNEPQRCAECRRAKKQQNNSFGGNRSGGNRPFNNNRKSN
ncbi:MAG: zinc-ribbon domain-containing protein [Firmicutes bacterium]|nr:zinc-ribbon domain-containing protein [Bacillota bacterium]